MVEVVNIVILLLEEINKSSKWEVNEVEVIKEVILIDKGIFIKEIERKEIKMKK